MSEMVDRVARAIQHMHDTGPKQHFQAFARAAIEAMREPTTPMIEAGDNRFSECWSLEHGEGLDENPTEPIWIAMIDAALKEEA